MSNLPWDSPSATAYDGSASETEALQTDVMRFLAILALCLMAIFALVQSIPTVPVEDSPQLQNREILLSQIAELEQRVRVLSEEAGTLEMAINTARADGRRARQEARAEQNKADRLAGLARVSQQAAKAALKRLEQTREALQTQNTRLSELHSTALQARESLRVLRKQVEREQTESTRLQAEIEDVREQLQTVPETLPPAEPPVKPSPGFTLRFDSADALQTLVRKGAVMFYAGTGSRVWLLRLTGSEPSFEPATGPRQLYEMTPSTVPTELVKAMQRSVAAFDHNTLTWGVTLPAAATAEIGRLMATHQGGILSIQADGRVVRRDVQD